MPLTRIPAQAESFFRQLPKAELHCHLLGTVSRETFEDLARRARAPLSALEIEAFYTRGEKPVGAIRVLRTLDALLIRSPDDLHRITYEYLRRAAHDGVRYSEFFWNPTGTARESRIAYPQAQAAIVRAIRDAQRDAGVIGRLIPSIDRQAPPADAVEMVRWVIANRAEEVIGIGMDYVETDRPPEMFVEAYALARQQGLKTTAHAGEFGLPWHNVRTAIELLKVDRIDHGYTVIAHADFAQRCAESGIVFTVVPTNSYYLRTLAPDRWALDHPIRAMVSLGLRVHPNTDDPTLHHVSPAQAWAMMMFDFGFEFDQLRACLLNGLMGAWIDDSTRRQWQSQWCADFDRLRAAWLRACP